MSCKNVYTLKIEKNVFIIYAYYMCTYALKVYIIK